MISDVSFGTLNSLKKVQNLFLRIFANFFFFFARFTFCVLTYNDCKS